MDNPAAELRDIFNSWKHGRETTQAARGFATDVHSATSQHVRAMYLIQQIHDVLDIWEREGRGISTYRKAAGTWARGVLAYPHGWTSQNSSIAIHREVDMGVLEALADTFSITGPRVDPAQLTNFDEFLRGIVDLLGEDESITVELRGYMLNLVQELHIALEQFQVTGSFDHADSLLRLWVSLQAAAGQSKTKKSKWKTFGSKIVVPATVQLLAGLPMATATTAIAIASSGG